ncbi:ATP-binding cassette domain-containing protein [Flavobacterium silvaticum]|uniref:ATP-binding cassette domain-containing protein n=1 Tax=Flavobacterium silvaticum TaxID=1852020 RepID=A0A972JJI2_9FLAO|nr:ATP-binding cassette domain-containing protein [Flavobacterium silvaticum]NMH29383.1 ATP-binding cassette domain-containing protein [Flavobacterium silvaticum]
MPENIIQTSGLNFRYSKKRPAIENLNLNVPKGSIYGFLGPNGAGKSTTMRLLTGIIPDDSNAISLFGKLINEQMPDMFSRIGALVESPALYLHLSGKDNLKYIARIKGISESRIDEILKIVELYDARNRKAKAYSLGMKQRLAIAMALLSEPELLLLDEPVNGLDPAGIVEIRMLLVKLNQEHGVSIFVSSHLLSEIEKMCTHIGIIAKGKLRFEGSMAQLSSQFSKCRVSLTLSDAAVWKDKLSGTYSEVEMISADKLSLLLPDKDSIPGFMQKLLSEGAKLYEVKIQDGLEEWFMELTSGKID